MVKREKLILVLFILSIIVICLMSYFLYKCIKDNYMLLAENEVLKIDKEGLEKDKNDFNSKNEELERKLKLYILEGNENNITEKGWNGQDKNNQNIQIEFYNDLSFKESEFEIKDTGEKTIEGGSLGEVPKKIERTGTYTISRNTIALKYDVERIFSYNETKKYELEAENYNLSDRFIEYIYSNEVKMLNYQSNGYNIELYEYNETEPDNIFLKPIIYLYPTETARMIVKLGYPEKLTCSYPKYEDNGWDVIANPDGTLVNNKTGKNLYSLYWEGLGTARTNMEEGFVVKGEDVAEFLEEKLEILGLNEKEKEEFIIYWLPKMENNKYNYVRFATIDEINEYMPIDFSKEPDTIIRIMMQFKGLGGPIEITEQKLETPIREGFVAVEWGGTELK